jgi:hypothetical protein
MMPIDWCQSISIIFLFLLLVLLLLLSLFDWCQSISIIFLFLLLVLLLLLSLLCWDIDSVIVVSSLQSPVQYTTASNNEVAALDKRARSILHCCICLCINKKQFQTTTKSTTLLTTSWKTNISDSDKRPNYTHSTTLLATATKS